MENEKKTLGLFDPFELPNGKKVRFKKPSVGDVERSNVMSSEYASQLLKEGKLMCRQEIQAYMDQKKEASDILRERITQTFNQLTILEEEYERVTDPEQKDRLTVEIQKMQMGIMENAINAFGLFDISVETQVDKYRRLCLMHLTTINDDGGSLLWPTMQSLMDEEDIESYNVIALRFSETQGAFNMNDEQRHALHELLSVGASSLSAITNENNP